MSRTEKKERRTTSMSTFPLSPFSAYGLRQLVFRLVGGYDGVFTEDKKKVVGGRKDDGAVKK